MKNIGILLLCLAFCRPLTASVPSDMGLLIQSDFPAKTVFIKHPGAAHIEEFLAASKQLNFYIYKPGSKADLEKIVKSFSANKAVENCAVGEANGDYQNIILILNKEQDKAWLIKLFSNAGLKNVRINNDPVIAVEKM